MNRVISRFLLLGLALCALPACRAEPLDSTTVPLDRWDVTYSVDEPGATTATATAVFETEEKRCIGCAPTRLFLGATDSLLVDGSRTSREEPLFSKREPFYRTSLSRAITDHRFELRRASGAFPKEVPGGTFQITTPDLSGDARSSFTVRWTPTQPGAKVTLFASSNSGTRCSSTNVGPTLEDQGFATFHADALRPKEGFTAPCDYRLEIRREWERQLDPSPFRGLTLKTTSSQDVALHINP